MKASHQSEPDESSNYSKQNEIGHIHHEVK